MTGCFVLGTLAAFGLLSVLWVLFGWLLTGKGEGWILCPGKSDALAFVARYLWLKGLGLVSCPLILVDLGLTEQERLWLDSREIEICSREEMLSRLGIGAESN